MTRALRFIAVVLAFGGIGLLTCNLMGYVLPPAEHPRAGGGERHKGLLAPITRDEALEGLDRLPSPLTDEDSLSKAAEIMARRIVRYWPAPDAADPDALYGPFENWYVALRQRIEAKPADGAEPGLAGLGRLAWRDVLSKGIGESSQASLAMIDFLAERGLDAGILPLEGHVVVVARVGERAFVVDADHGTSFEVPPSRPRLWMDAARAGYARAGLSGEELDAAAELLRRPLTPQPLPLETFAKGMIETLRRAQSVKWGVPLALLALSAAAAWLGSRRPSQGPG